MPTPENPNELSQGNSADSILAQNVLPQNGQDLNASIVKEKIKLEYSGPFYKYRGFTPQIRQDGLLCSFGEVGTQKIIEARKRLDFSKSTINVLTWESPGASAGGILPVVRNSAYGWNQMIKEREGQSQGIPVRHFTPFHKNIITAEVKIGAKEVGMFDVVFEGRKIACKLYHYEDRKGYETNEKGADWYFIDPVDEPEIFSAIGDGVKNSGKNPYIYDAKHVSGHDNWRLALDSIFFSKATIEAVNFLERQVKPVQKPTNQIFWGHDWQTATAAFEVCEVLSSERFKSAAFFLQLHNFYDNILDSAVKGPLITKRNFPYDFKENTSFLNSMIRFVTGGPVLTVSSGMEKAALNKNPDIIHMLGELDKDLSHLHHDSSVPNLVGISNPKFEVTSDPLTTEERQLRKSDFLAFSQDFIAKKKQLASELRQLVNSSNSSKFGSLSNEDKPIFFSMGRDDLAQKGWLVLIDAIGNYPKGKAQFVLAIPQAPMDSDYIKELLQVVAERPGEIVFYNKGIFGREKELALKASTFMVFPSQYEPFGCAIEALANYTPVISRRTCGLEDQVICYREDTENYNATGILYRENPTHSHNSRSMLRHAKSIREIQQLPLLVDQRDRLINALDLGCELFLDDEAYTRLSDNAYLHSLSFDQKIYAESIFHFLETVC